jgi:hypothetical protein
VTFERLEERHAPTQESIHAVIGENAVPVL